ncbi:unnamed protein product [Caenorhabditis nigoni]
MILRTCLVFSIYVFWLCSAASNDTALSPLIEKSASLARISTAISIHNGIYSKKSIVQEVTAEFLDLSPPVAKELLEHDYGSLSDNMNKFYGSLCKIPAKLKNGDELVNTIKLLLNMKVNQEYLKPGAIGDQTAHFAKTKQIMVNSSRNSNEILENHEFETTAKLFRKVRESDGHAMEIDEIYEILSELNEYLGLVEFRINLIIDYKTSMKDYLSLESLTKDLQPVINAAGIAREYTETITKLDPFRKDLMAASKDTDQIKKATDEILKYSESIQHLSTSSFLNSTALKFDGKMMTLGLIGYKDLNNVWSDFENPWFRKNVLSNLDSTILRQGLESLKPFVSALDSLIPLKQLDNEKETKTILDLAKKINEVHEIGSKVKSVKNSKTPYEEVSKCIEPLRPIQNPPDQEMLQRVEEFSEHVVKSVKFFSMLMNDLGKHDLKNIITVSKEVVKNIEYVTSEKNDSLKIKMWDKARELEKQHKLASTFQIFTDIISKDPGDLFSEDRTIDYDVIRTTATDFIKNLLKLQTNFKNMIRKMKSTKVSEESQKLIDSKNFKEIGSNSKVIGGSVAALRATESISKAEKSIRSVVAMDADVKFEIQKSLGLKSTDSLIQKMTLAETSVGEILKVLNTKRIDSIPQIQSIFTSLSQLKNQTDIEDENILNLALDMANQTDPKVQSFAKELLAISQLDMRFANHQKSFDVKNSLELTKNMLVNFLQTYIDEQDAEKRRAAENSSNSNYLVPILIACLVIGLIATAVTCFICWYRGFGLWHFVESGDLESGNHGKAQKRKFGFRKKDKTESKSKMSKPKKNGKTESKSKMSKPKEKENKSEDKKKKEETKEKSKTSQISQIPKSAEQ